MRYLLFLSVYFSLQTLFSQNEIHIPRQPYLKYTFVSTDTITYYLSETTIKSRLPLVIYIQGSGNTSLFKKMNDGSIAPNSGHINWYDISKDRYRVLIVEKPGVHFLQNDANNKAFDLKFSLESWTKQIAQTLLHVLKTQAIDSSKILVAGHSEGGLVAAALTNYITNKPTHVCIIAGEGPSQLYSLYRFAEEGVFFNSANFSKEQRIDSVKKIWSSIQKEPLSTEKKFWGFTYLRWSVVSQFKI